VPSPRPARTARPVRRIAAVGCALALVVACHVSVGPAARAATPTAQVWITTPDGSRKLTRSPDAAFDGRRLKTDIAVDAAEKAQRFTGAGASMTEASAHLIAGLPAGKRASLLGDLFSRDGGGIGLNYLRQPLGGTDFVARLPYYTYEGTPGTFSVARDEQEILPLLRRALKINPSVRVMASPWSAPAWMKDNGRLGGGRVAPEHYGDYADYLVKSVRAYRKAGVPVADLTVGNEPLFAAVYPSMNMSSGEQAELFRVLDRKLTAAGLGTGLFAFDHNWDHPEYALDVLRRTTGIARVQGASFHCYGGKPEQQQAVRDAGGRVFFTECSGTDGDDGTQDFSQALGWQTGNWVIRTLRSGSETVVLWNLALDKDGGPHYGYCRHCNGVVQVDGDSVHRNAEYYTLGHVAKFVDRGARRVASTTQGAGGVQNVTFENPDGSRASVVLNDARTARTFSITENGRSLSYELPAGAVATFTWPGPPGTR